MGSTRKGATLDDIVLVRIDERDYFRCWRPGSAPKKDAALFRISLARFNSWTSCSSSRSFHASRCSHARDVTVVDVSLLDPHPDRLDPVTELGRNPLDRPVLGPELRT